jgi:hypothetical protein
MGKGKKKDSDEARRISLLRLILSLLRKKGRGDKK